MITTAVVMLVAIAPTAAQTNEPPPPESKVVDKPTAAELPPLPEPKAERQPEPPPLPEPRTPAEELAAPPETSDPAQPPALNPEPMRRIAPQVRLGVAAGLTHDLKKRGTGTALRVSAAYSDFLPIIDPQILFVQCLGLPNHASPLALFGAGARVTFPPLGPAEVGLDLAVLLDAHGKPRSQIGAVFHVQLARTLQAGIFVAHISPSPAEAGILTQGLELQIFLL